MVRVASWRPWREGGKSWKDWYRVLERRSFRRECRLQAHERHVVVERIDPHRGHTEVDGIRLVVAGNPEANRHVRAQALLNTPLMTRLLAG